MRHIHEAGDGLPPREVMLDGVVIKSVTYANTLCGEVRRQKMPIEIDVEGDIVQETLHGHVEVRFL